MEMTDYDFEIKKIVLAIKKKKAKTVLVQLPDGLKPFATKIADELSKTEAEIFVWAGTCFGACDIPNADFDLIVQFGHNELKWKS